MNQKTARQCLKDFELHRLVEKQYNNDKISYILTDSCVKTLGENFLFVQLDSPNDTQMSWQVQALILTVLEMGEIFKDSLTDYVNVLNKLVPPECWSVRAKEEKS